MKPQCTACSSERIILGARVMDYDDATGLSDLRVLVCRAAGAPALHPHLYAELKAQICGDCGHVALRVANPRELYRKYQESVT